MSKAPQQVTVRVDALKVHPLLEDAPRLPKKDPRYTAMKASWEESGVIPSIFVTPDNEIVDGRHRYWFAQENGIEELHAQVVDPSQVPSIILGALSGRNHATKAQLAYLASPALAAAFEAARERRAKIVESGGKARLPPVANADELAERLGVSETYLKQAQRIHEAFSNETLFDFANPPAAAASLIFDSPEEIAEYTTTPGGRKKRKLTLRGFFEPKILDPENPLSLGDVLKGIGYFLNGAAEKSSGKAPTRNSHLHVFTSSWKMMSKSAPRWGKISPEDRDAAARDIEKGLAKFPEGLLEFMRVKIAAQLRARKNAEKIDDLPEEISAE